MVSDSALCLQTGYCALGGLSDVELLLSMFKGFWVDGRDGLPSRSAEPVPSPVPGPTIRVTSMCAAASVPACYGDPPPPGSLLSVSSKGTSLLLQVLMTPNPSQSSGQGHCLQLFGYNLLQLPFFSSEHLLCVLQKRLKPRIN